MALRRFSKRSVSDTPDKAAAAPAAKPPKSRRDQPALYNRLAGVFLILTLVMLACYVIIFIVPQIPLNPFRPYSLALATFAPTLTPQPTPTATFTPTPTDTPTVTPRPTWTPTWTPTPKVTAPLTGTLRSGTRTPTSTPIPTIGPTLSPFNYTAEVLYQRNQLYGTNWSGIAGLIFGTDLKHQPGIGVKAWGDEPLGPSGQLLPSGTASQYGPSGFQFTLGDKPMSGKYNVQLLGPAGEPISPIVEVELKGDPRANMAYLIFRQNH